MDLTLTTVSLCACQLTVEKLCRLKSLHSGLSPAVLRGLQWAEIGDIVHCQCWRTLLTELKPSHRAMLFKAMQEVRECITYHFCCLFTVFTVTPMWVQYTFGSFYNLTFLTDCAKSLQHRGKCHIKKSVLWLYISTGCTERRAEHHTAGKLPFTICASEETDRGE